MKDDVFRAHHRFARTRDQLLAALAEDLDGDIVGDAVLVYEATDEVELDLRSGRETNLDFLESDLHEHLEIFEFLLDAHGLGERLIAVAEIDAAPHGCLGLRAAGPLAIG